MTSSIRRLTPLDGRYERQVGGLRDAFSEYALIRERVRVEVEWLIAMGAEPAISDVRPLTEDEQRLARSLAEAFDETSAQRVKEIERTTNHDVKAVEYFIKERLQGDTELGPALEFVHFACTSEDINNLSYALMLQQAYTTVIAPRLWDVVGTLTEMAHARSA